MTLESKFTIVAPFIRLNTWYGEHLLSLSEVFLEGVGEPFGVLHELSLALLQGLLARDARNVCRYVVDCVQKLLDGACDVPENRGGNYIQTSNINRDICLCGY